MATTHDHEIGLGIAGVLMGEFFLVMISQEELQESVARVWHMLDTTYSSGPHSTHAIRNCSLIDSSRIKVDMPL